MGFVDPTTGQQVDLPEADAQQAFLAGKVGVSGDEVPVRDSLGNVGTVPADQLQAALQSGAYSLASEQAFKQAQEQARYGTAGQMLATGAEGLARGASLGISDMVLSDLGGDEYQRDLAARARTNKGIATGTEIAGFALPMLASRGTAASEIGTLRAGSALERAAALGRLGVSAPTRLMSGAGGLVERGAAEVLGGLGSGTGARALQAIAPRVLGGATEGAILGAGQAVSQTALGNPDARAEELIALGALTGGLLSGGMVLGGAGIRAGGRALQRGATRAGDGTVNLAEALMNRGKETALRLEQDAQRVLAENKGAIGEFAVDRGFKATGGLGKKGDALNALQGDARSKAANIVFEEAPAALGKKSGAVLSREEQAAAFGKVRQQYGQEIGGAVKEIGGLGYKPNLSQIADDLRAKVLPELDTAFTKAEKEQVEGVIRQMEEHYGAKFKELADGSFKRTKRATTQTFEDLQKSRRTLDDKISWANTSNLKPLARAFRDIRNGLEDGWISNAEQVIEAHVAKLTKAGDAEGAKAIQGMVGKFKGAKTGYRAATVLQDAAEDGVKRELKNRTAGLSEHLVGMAGGFTGSLVGGPVGSVLGAGIGGAGAWGAKHYGDQALAAMAYKLSKGATVREVAASMNAQIRDGVAGFLEKSSLGRSTLEASRRVLDSGREAGRRLLAEASDLRRVAGDTASRAATGTRRLAQRGAVLSLPEYTQARAEIREQQDRPELLAASVQATGLQHVEPEVARAMVGTAKRVNAFLDSKLPSQPMRPSLGGPRLLPPTPQALEKFSRFERAARDPLSVLDDLRDNDLSPEAVEALRVCYPQLYGDITATVVDAVAEAGDEIPYDRRIALGLLLGVPTDPTLTPEYRAAMDAADSMPTPERSQPVNRPTPKPAPSRATHTERIASR